MGNGSSQMATSSGERASEASMGNESSQMATSSSKQASEASMGNATSSSEQASEASMGNATSSGEQASEASMGNESSQMATSSGEQASEASMGNESSQIATSSSTSRRVTYDVFISFRGVDTRLGFADHLYSGLKRKGLIVFRDEEKLDRGESISKELLKAIRESEYAVIIISENFAFSKWCLIELIEILKCKRENGLKVLPVFYDVEPRHVRMHIGSFARAFAKHEEDKVDEQQMKIWRDALKEVGKLAGWDVRDRYQSVVIEEICKKIFDGLNRQILEIADNLVGIDFQIEELMTLLCIKGDDVRFIGICGMGGIGKTTLAEVIYSKVFSRFEASCFISNVREESQRFGSLLSLQKELISQIFDEKEPKIPNTFQGRSMIASKAKNKKVFIVLDDVDKGNQLEELVGKHNWFGEGSRVLITSRDRLLLKKHVDEIYDIKKLTHYDALQLFNLKAFKQRYYTGKYAQYCNEIVKHAGGLPLALKVFGSFLFDRKSDAWESALDRLKADPDSNILDRLQISFEELGNLQKRLFLDIACFFKGKLVDKVTYKMRALGHFPEIDIPILESKSLITISKDNILEMHDLLQEMGHQIVYRESPKEPGERSRLWYYKDIIHVLKNNTGTSAIESIVLKLPLPKPVKLSFEVFSKIKKLRMLVICPICEVEASNVSNWFEEVMMKWYGDPSKLKLEWYGNPSKLMLSSELHILEWWGFPLEYIPNMCDLDNLVFLKMPMSYIKQPWDTRKTFDKLTYIDLSHLQNSIEMLDFSKIPNIEVFDASGTTLRQLQSSTIFPKELDVLRVTGSYSNPMSSLVPNSISQSSSLVKLQLRYCNMVDGVLPYNLGCLSSLKYLDLIGNKFTELPNSISQLSNLCELRLNYCTQLQTLPPNIFQLSKLELLQLHHCTQLHTLPPKLPMSLGLLGVDFCPLLDTFYDPIDTSSSSIKLLTGDSSIRGCYFGYEDKPYASLHLVPYGGEIPGEFRDPRINIAWGPTLKTKIPKWFKQRSTSFCSQCRMTLDLCSAFWGLALYIVYEIHEPNNCEREEKPRQGVEHRSSTSGILDGNNSTCVVFVCELENKACGSSVPIVFRVPEVLPFGQKGVWVFITDAALYSNMYKGEQINVSVTTRSLNVEVKECGAHIITRDQCEDFHKVLSSISPHGSHLQSSSSLDMGSHFVVLPKERGKSEEGVNQVRGKKVKGKGGRSLASSIGKEKRTTWIDLEGVM